MYNQLSKTSAKHALKYNQKHNNDQDKSAGETTSILVL